MQAGEIAEAPPAADEARRFRGSAPAVGRVSGRESAGTTVGRHGPRPTGPLIPKPVKKLEKLFIAPKVRQVLYGTSQRALARCACAQRTGFLIKFLIRNQY